MEGYTSKHAARLSLFSSAHHQHDILVATEQAEVLFLPLSGLPGRRAALPVVHARITLSTTTGQALSHMIYFSSQNLEPSALLPS